MSRFSCDTFEFFEFFFLREHLLRFLTDEHDRAQPWWFLSAILIGGTLLGLHAHPATDSEAVFSEFRCGLDHIGFGCADRAALASWEQRLDELGIAHGGIVDAHYGSGLSFRDPDGIALEFFAPPS